MTALAAAFYAFPAGHMVFWSAIGVVSAGAMILGVVRHRPRRPVPWLVLAAAVLTFAAGDLTFNLLTTVWHRSDPFPSLADVFYVVTAARQVGGPVDVGWIVLYTGFGLAALHPSMGAVTEPRAMRPGEVGAVRLTLLALSSLIAPAVLLVEAVRGTVRDGVLIAGASSVTFALVLGRLGGVVNRHRQALARERGLRESANALLLAQDVAAVTAAVRGALARLPCP